MRFLLLNQTFHPDVAATGQYLTDLALGLVERGHEVTVVASRRAYDQPGLHFPVSEIWRGIRIWRVGCTGFGKGAKWRRAGDFASFMASCWWRLLCLPQQHVVVALTSPPLISFIGACVSRLWRSRFAYWVMDLNPDQAVAAGWLQPRSAAATALEAISRFSFRSADKVIVLDRFVRRRIAEKGVREEKLVILPPWSQDDHVSYDPAGRARFRKTHRLDDKFVVMYSGNHSPCHPLDTLLQAARRLASHHGVMFCFVGGGSEWTRIAEAGAGRNVLCLGYQSRQDLSASLSAADLQVVIMGNGMVGLVHSCKVYNVLKVQAPVLYIGPEPSHVSEILARLNEPYLWRCAAHGEVERVVQFIRQLRATPLRRAPRPPAILRSQYGMDVLRPRLLAELET